LRAGGQRKSRKKPKKPKRAKWGNIGEKSSFVLYRVAVIMWFWMETAGFWECEEREHCHQKCNKMDNGTFSAYSIGVKTPIIMIRGKN